MAVSAPVVVIGGGVIGCGITYELSQHSNVDIFVVEQNNSILSDNQSSRNSGVIHGGVYYLKSRTPLKARFCVDGNGMLYDFCEKNNIAHKRTGKLIVATNSLDEDYIDKLVLPRAIENGVPDIEMIDGRRVSQLEPNIKATSALLVPSSGIVDATGVVRTFRNISESRGVHFLTGSKVIGISPKGDGFIVTTKTGNSIDSFEAGLLLLFLIYSILILLDYILTRLREW